MRIPDHVLDEIRSRLPVSTVVSKKVDLKKAGQNELRGLSPFKVEKSPSFFVNDGKGFAHCFSSGWHGDIFAFLMETQNINFREAVEILAAEAGVAIPKDAPQSEAERQAIGRRERMICANEAAVAFFRAELAQSVKAQRYLAAREITPATAELFQIGFAPDAFGALKSALMNAGHDESDLFDAGLLRKSDKGTTYDAFRGRLMLPYHGANGYPVGFGGRVLDPDAKPKYLNTSETELFHKGTLLFNHHRARAAARKASRLVVVEGYLDTVSLTQAGISEAVAVIGVAINATQLLLMWQANACPIIMLDGDEAGIAAAHRLIDTALPLLAPGKSLRFAFLPSGLDPDDLVRMKGREAVEVVLDSAREMVDVLWEREWQARVSDTPEARAAFDARLADLVGKIGDRSIAHHYQHALRLRVWEAFRPQPRGSEASRGVHFAPSAPAPAREAWLLNAVLSNSNLLHDVAEDLAALAFSHRPFSVLRDAMLSIVTEDPDADVAGRLTDAGRAQTVVLAAEASAALSMTPATPATWRRMADVQDRIAGRVARLRNRIPTA